MAVDPNDLFVSPDFRFVGGRLEKITGDLKPVDSNDLANVGPVFLAAIAAAGVRQLVAADFAGYPFNTTELWVPLGINGVDVRLPADAANGCVGGARINVLKPPGSAYSYTLSSPTHGILYPGGSVVANFSIPSSTDPSSWQLVFDSTLNAWRVLSIQQANGAIWERLLNDLAVSTAKLQDNAITAIKIAAGAVTPSKLSPLRRELLLSGTVTNPTLLTLTADTTIGTWPAVTSNAQEVPEAGKYRVLAYATITTTLATNPSIRALELVINGSLTGKQFARGVRHSATVGDDMELAPLEQVITITNPATEKIGITTSAGTITISGGPARLVIEKVSN